VTQYRVRISTLALQQIDRASAWWQKNRDKAPTALEEDIDEVIALIRRSPGIGQPVQLRKPARRVWMPRIRFFLYYREHGGDLIEIIALWHGSRRSPSRV
jgi:plasmid stabilization system protein ParE